jgi:hypothetical protein
MKTRKKTSSGDGIHPYLRKEFRWPKFNYTQGKPLLSEEEMNRRAEENIDARNKLLP